MGAHADLCNGLLMVANNLGGERLDGVPLAGIGWVAIYCEATCARLAPARAHPPDAIRRATPTGIHER